MIAEDYVSFEQAVKLREKKIYLTDTPYVYSSFKCKYGKGCYICMLRRKAIPNFAMKYVVCSCPTLISVAKKLREEKDLFLQVIMNCKGKYICKVCKISKQCDIINKSDFFDTYEQALSAGIDKALKLLSE